MFVTGSFQLLHQRAASSSYTFSNIVNTTGKTIAIIDPRADLRCAIIICKETPGNNEGSTDPKHRNASQEEKQPKGHDLDR